MNRNHFQMVIVVPLVSCFVAEMTYAARSATQGQPNMSSSGPSRVRPSQRKAVIGRATTTTTTGNRDHGGTVKSILTIAMVCTAGVALIAGELQTAASCRTFSAEEVRTLTGAGGGTINQTCRFDLPSTSRICTMRTRLTNTSFDLTLTDTYYSVADFVDEVRMVPPISRVQKQSRRYTSGSGVNGDIAYEYDAMRRQTRLTSSVGGNLLLTTYNAWDPKGRPTAAIVSSRASTINLQYKYDDELRTMTMIGPVGNQTYTYDADGNMIKEESTAGSGSTVHNIRIDKTEKVCR